MRYSLLKASAVAGLLLGSMAGAHAAIVTSLTPIANVPGTGPNGTGALGINDSGIIAGGWWDTNNVQHGFYGPPDGSNYTSFDDGTLGTEARSINNKGELTGYFYSSTLSCSVGQCEFERTVAGKNSTVTMSGTPLTGIAQGIDSAGEFVGGYQTAGGQGNAYYGKSHLYQSDITLPFPVAYIAARGLNDNGDVVGFFITADGSALSGFVIQGSTVTVVNDPRVNAVNGTYLEGINKKGWIVGQWEDKIGLPHAFILSPDLSTFYEIAVPGSTFTQSFSINSSNRAVVNSDPGGFIYCDSRTHPAPNCPTSVAATASVQEPITVPRGTFAQYKCNGDCITYRLATPGAPKAHTSAVPARLLQASRPGIYLP